MWKPAEMPFNRNPPVSADMLLDSLQRIEQSRHLAQVKDAVRAIAAPLGYDRFAMLSMAAIPDAIVGRVYWLEGDWFGDGSAVDAVTYLQRCPVTQHVLQTDEAFFWSKTPGHTEELYRVVQSPAGPGIHGLQVPVFGRTGLEGALSLGGTSIDCSVKARLMLAWIGKQSIRKARNLLENTERELPIGLSGREREVLQWVASGRRQADIAAILGLSQRTVENHLRRARLRLGVATTAQAIRAAIHNGEIKH